MNGAVAKPAGKIDIMESPLAKAYSLYMAYFVTTAGYAWIYLNATKILTSGSAEGVNVSSTAIYMGVSVSFLVYGFLKRDRVIVIGSIISLLGNLFLLAAVFTVTST